MVVRFVLGKVHFIEIGTLFNNFVTYMKARKESPGLACQNVGMYVVVYWPLGQTTASHSHQHWQQKATLPFSETLVQYVFCHILPTNKLKYFK